MIQSRSTKCIRLTLVLLWNRLQKACSNQDSMPSTSLLTFWDTTRLVSGNLSTQGTEGLNPKISRISGHPYNNLPHIYNLLRKPSILQSVQERARQGFPAFGSRPTIQGCLKHDLGTMLCMHERQSMSCIHARTNSHLADRIF